jgi:3-hydroxyisobutyrate dehydrogenase
MSRIGLIGVGRIGLPVCAHLVRGGRDVLVADRDPARRIDVERCGARWAPSPRSLIGAVDVVITSLPGSPELRGVMWPLLGAMRDGATWIDITSTAPELGAELRGLARHVVCIDAPVGGGPAQAETAELALYVGGDPDAVRRHRDTLETFGVVHHVGGPGAGQVVKHLINLLWFGQAVATGEALLLARRAGLDLATVRDVLVGSAADSRFIRHDLEALLGGDYLTSFGIDRCSEELDAVVGLAVRHGVPFELSTVVRDIYRRAMARFGDQDGELLAVAMLEQDAGIELRTSSSSSSRSDQVD